MTEYPIRGRYNDPYLVLYIVHDDYLDRKEIPKKEHNNIPPKIKYRYFNSKNLTKLLNTQAEYRESPTMQPIRVHIGCFQISIRSQDQNQNQWKLTKSNSPCQSNPVDYYPRRERLCLHPNQPSRQLHC